MKLISCVAICVLAVSLGGCSKLSRITGSTDDTVLQGNREQIISPDQMTAKDPIVTGQAQADAPVAPSVPCDPKKKICTDSSANIQ